MEMELYMFNIEMNIVLKIRITPASDTNAC